MKKRFYTLTLGIVTISMILLMTGCDKDNSRDIESMNTGTETGHTMGTEVSRVAAGSIPVNTEVSHTGNSTSGEESVSIDGEADSEQSEKLEWYTRLIVEMTSEKMQDKGNVLGQLNDSIKGYDSHDLREMEPFGSTYLTIVFPHPEWKNRAGDYTSDYHNPDLYHSDAWTFEVRSSAVNSDVKLYWEGLIMLNKENSQLKNDEENVINTLQEHMWLEDMKTGKRIPAVVNKTLQSYTFNMGGKHVRRFRWVLGKF